MVKEPNATQKTKTVRNFVWISVAWMKLLLLLINAAAMVPRAIRRVLVPNRLWTLAHNII